MNLGQLQGHHKWCNSFLIENMVVLCNSLSWYGLSVRCGSENTVFQEQNTLYIHVC